MAPTFSDSMENSLPVYASKEKIPRLGYAEEPPSQRGTLFQNQYTFSIFSLVHIQESLIKLF